uniref:Uncharacterized protein n=1 Tax=Arundo donax TaxID=35708 RepID=A0A0A9E5N0_ARUDO
MNNQGSMYKVQYQQCTVASKNCALALACQTNRASESSQTARRAGSCRSRGPQLQA